MKMTEETLSKLVSELPRTSVVNYQKQYRCDVTREYTSPIFKRTSMVPVRNDCLRKNYVILAFQLPETLKQLARGSFWMNFSLN